jgi:hypothetical protein
VFGAVLETLAAYRRSREIFLEQVPGGGRDRRVFQRVQLQTACRLSNPVFGLESSGTTTDISLDGLGVIAPVNWAHGNRIRLSLGAAGFEASGVIVFRREEAPNFRYGVRFEKTGLLQILKLRRFLKQTHKGRLKL